jgi:hypothetical protein
VFFGRRQDVLRLASLVRAQYTVLLHSESGAGKSSMVEAALRPELTRRGCLVLPRGRLQQATTPEVVAPNPYVSDLLQCWRDRGVEPADPAATTLAGFLGVQTAPFGRPNVRVVVLDQFEDLFILYPGQWPQRKDFFEQVQEALDTDPSLRFLFVMRGDYLARIGPYKDLLEDGLRTQFPLDRLRRDNAIEAIMRPAEEAGRSFDDKAATMLVDSLLALPTSAGEPDGKAEHVEAVELQIACRDLWEKLRPEETVIREEHLRDLGGLDQIMGRFYDRAVAETAARTKVKELAIRTWFDKHLITKARTRGIVVQEEQTTADLPNRAVAELEERRVIRSEPRGRTLWFELTHDRLVNAVVDSNQRWFQRREAARWRKAIIGVAVASVLLLGLLLWRALFTQPEEAEPITSLIASGEITASSDVIEHEFAGSEGDTIVLSVRPDDDMDTTLRLVAPDGAELPQPDRADEHSGSHVVQRLPMDGVYKALVSSPDPGKYKLRGGLVDVVTPVTRTPQLAEIDNSGEVDVYTFHQDGPGILVVEMRAENALDGVIEVVGPDGELLVTADDTGSGYDPFVGMYLSATGDYRVEASSYDDNTGPYTMRIERPGVTSLDGGDQMRGSVASGDRLAYTVNGSKDEVIVVHMVSRGRLDCSVALFGPEGDLLAEAGSARGRNATVAHVMTTAGRHTIVASSQDEASSGSFQISLLLRSRLEELRGKLAFR